jgi:hypothetical protein
LFNPVSDTYYVAIRGKLQELLSRIVANFSSARAATYCLKGEKQGLIRSFRRTAFFAAGFPDHFAAI